MWFHLTLRSGRSGNSGWAPSFSALDTALSTRGRSDPNVRKMMANSLPSCTRSLSSWKKEGRIQWYSRPSSPLTASSLSPCREHSQGAVSDTELHQGWRMQCRSQHIFFSPSKSYLYLRRHFTICPGSHFGSGTDSHTHVLNTWYTVRFELHDWTGPTATATEYSIFHMMLFCILIIKKEK